MSNANSIRYFMRDELRQEHIVEVPGLPTFCDEQGNPIPFKIRQLSSNEIFKLRERCKTRTMLKDKRGKPLLVNGEPKFSEEYDSAMVTNLLIATALVFPDMHSKELLDFYGTPDSLELVGRMFCKVEDYQYISNMVLEVCGLNNEDEADIVETAKN